MGGPGGKPGDDRDAPRHHVHRVLENLERFFVSELGALPGIHVHRDTVYPLMTLYLHDSCSIEGEMTSRSVRHTSAA